MGEFINVCSGAGAGTLPANEVKAILYNVPQAIKGSTSITNTKILIENARPTYLFQDSGGFQLHQTLANGGNVSFNENMGVMVDGVLNLTPAHLIGAAKIFKPDIMISLDNPIPKVKESTPSKQNVKFLENHGFNLRWAKETSQLRSKYCPEIKLFVPVQCYTLQQLKYFLEDFADIPCDGFSIPVRNHSPREIALFLLQLYQRGCRQAHILGTFTYRTIALASYFARHYYDFISLDCTLWRSDAEFSKYYYPLDLRSVILRDDYKIDGTVENTCNCPWCKGKDFTTIKNMPYTEKTGLLRRHNYFVIEEAMRDFYANAETADSLKDYLSTHTGRKEEIKYVYNFLKMLEAFKDNLNDFYINLLNKTFC